MAWSMVLNKKQAQGSPTGSRGKNATAIIGNPQASIEAKHHSTGPAVVLAESRPLTPGLNTLAPNLPQRGTTSRYGLVFKQNRNKRPQAGPKLRPDHRYCHG